MGYETALSKAWSELENMTNEDQSVKFLNDEYSLDLKKREIFSSSCNIPAKPHYSILILHYLIQKLKGLPAIEQNWISFKELTGGQPYYVAFKKRVIDTIERKYKDKPEALLELTERFKAKRVQMADISIALDTFNDSVPILITFWRADEEFGPQANVLFDKNIKDIFCTEDVVILAEIVAHSV